MYKIYSLILAALLIMVSYPVTTSLSDTDHLRTGLPHEINVISTYKSFFGGNQWEKQ